MKKEMDNTTRQRVDAVARKHSEHGCNKSDPFAYRRMKYNLFNLFNNNLGVFWDELVEFEKDYKLDVTTETLEIA